MSFSGLFSNTNFKIVVCFIVFSHRVVLTQKLVLSLKPKIKPGFTIKNYYVKTNLKPFLNCL